jgi:7-carboxy-7-deazaguanine synthase
MPIQKSPEVFNVNEIFGPVIQGEGIAIGAPMVFIRMQGCDYRCVWCDTGYALDPTSEGVLLTVPQIISEVNSISNGCHRVAITGGNPLLFHLDELVMSLKQQSYWVMVETQGSIYKPWVRMCDTIVVSPKPPSSGMPTRFDRLDRFMELAQVSLKVVVFNSDDYDFAMSLHERYPHVPMSLQVGNDVGEDSTEALVDKLRWLAEKVTKSSSVPSVFVLPQLHVLMYGNRRGV